MLASDSCFQQRPTQILFLFLLQLVFWYLGSSLAPLLLAAPLQLPFASFAGVPHMLHVLGKILLPTLSYAFVNVHAVQFQLLDAAVTPFRLSSLQLLLLRGKL